MSAGARRTAAAALAGTVRESFAVRVSYLVAADQLVGQCIARLPHAGAIIAGSAKAGRRASERTTQRAAASCKG